MSLNAELFAFAEGAVVSNSGQISMVNVRPIFEPAVFPAALRFSIVLIVIDSGQPELLLVADKSTVIKFEISDDQGTVIAAGSAQAVVLPSGKPNAPASLNFSGDLVMQFDKPGIYTTTLCVEIDEQEELRVEKGLYVLQARS
jgi:hypothetical protein